MTLARPPRPGDRVLVAMSGGVDSSVAAALLVEQGYDVVGATMKTFCYTGTGDHGRSCCGLDGIVDAGRVADRLGIPHYVFDVEEDFTRDVIDDFVAEYAAGRTPNPCVRCNSFTKFQDLVQRGRALECRAIATGHYVRIEHTAGGSRLLRGIDVSKDQSYFLWGLPAAHLRGLLFPLGQLTKPEVRARARALELETADKPESQEICFVPTGDYRDLLQKRLAPRHPSLVPGPVVTVDGDEVGRHDGYAGFTIGQRRGLGGGFDEPMFVVAIRPESREVVIGPRSALAVSRLQVDSLNWLTTAPDVGATVGVQIRHRAPAVEARITDRAATTVCLEFLEPRLAVTPGQSAVLFQGDVVVGGGRIHSTHGHRAADQLSGVASVR